jgi:hypothetical protein
MNASLDPGHPSPSMDRHNFSPRIAAVESSTSGLIIGGNCRDGISLGDNAAPRQNSAALLVSSFEMSSSPLPA